MAFAPNFPVPFGPFDLTPKTPLVMTPRVRLSQQYAEVIHSGTNNKVRLSQQYAEVIHSGTNNKVRLSQQYVEVIHEYGAPLAGAGDGGTILWRRRRRS